MSLPKWQCHKVVEAAKIVQITHTKGEVLLGLADGLMQAVPLTYDRRHTPAVGGYYVRYADGYESYSPADAFEAGYTRLPEETPT